ncbi:MAG: PP2C family protein-serine/threonine phosphatase [Proteobacteria bacterium]|nr:PP2C family protein-serine/threonine phosphatase [Pseudomonadota bacterium]
MLKNLSITIKVLIFTLLIGTLVWVSLDKIQSKAIQELLFAELANELEIRAKEDRAIFDRYIRFHNQATKLIISQQRFQAYFKNDKWLNNVDIKHHYRLPAWLPTSSVMRVFFHAKFAILIDQDKQVREVYHYFPEDLPPKLIKPTTLLQKLTHNQSYMTNLDGIPYIISSRDFTDQDEQTIATLMLASPIDDDFLMRAIGGYALEGAVVTLLDGDPVKIIATSNSDLLPANTVITNLTDEYIKTGASFFDYGASDTSAYFASFMKKERAYYLADHILTETYNQRIIFAIALILAFVLIILWITQKIRQVTRKVGLFAKDSLGLDIKYNGDEIARIVTSFQQLQATIQKTIDRATGIAAGNYSLETKSYCKQDKLGTALTNMNETLQVQAEELHQQQEELRQTNESLQNFNNELELRVAERTGQLSTANQEITKLNKRLKGENLRLGTELDVARQLQTMVLPTQTELENIKDLDIATFMEPAAEVGGDYYDVLQHNGNIKIGIGDVTGHGLESGVLMLMVQTAVRTLLVNNVDDPKIFLNVINRVIYDNVQRMESDKNLTLSLLDYSKGTLNISGQHEEVLVVRKNGCIERIDTFDLGFMVGLEPDISSFVNKKSVILAPGDGIVLYTDGVTEAMDLNHKVYGIERLCKIINSNWQYPAKDIKQTIISDIREHIGSHQVYDDITFLVLKQK